MALRRRSLLKPILTAGLVAGTLDILDPILFFYFRNHVHPIRILQHVASGLLGRAAFAGGMRTAAIGLAIHFCIALTWAAIFVLAARRFTILRRAAVISGLLYGGFIYVFMNFVVLPLTRSAPPARTIPILLINAVCAIVFLVGLPIALINKRLT